MVAMIRSYSVKLIQGNIFTLVPDKPQVPTQSVPFIKLYKIERDIERPLLHFLGRKHKGRVRLQKLSTKFEGLDVVAPVFEAQ